MFINLTDMCWIGNGEHKGMGRGSFFGRMFETRASFSHFCFLSDRGEEVIDLLVRRLGDQFSFALAQFLGEMLELYVLVDRHDCGTQRLCIQLANELLKLRVERLITMI